MTKSTTSPVRLGPIPAAPGHENKKKALENQGLPIGAAGFEPAEGICNSKDLQQGIALNRETNAENGYVQARLDLSELASQLAALPSEDRAKLAAMLKSRTESSGQEP